MRGVTYPEATVEAALALGANGLSDYAVAEILSIPRATIQNWRTSGAPTKRGAGLEEPLERPLEHRAYAYLFGIYLGDGCVSGHRRTFGLQVTLDADYPHLMVEVKSAIERSIPVLARVQRPRRGAVRIWAFHRSLPNLFPQHGPGKKHERKIELVPWQTKITHRYTREFIRGLIHSDGSRCMNRFAVDLPSGRVGRYAYPRYFFTNYSADIRRIFCEHCELLGIRWTQSNARNISVSHRDSVALLDEFVGPKS
jgi:hypothetical protein